jgi:hypothetical protein
MWISRVSFKIDGSLQLLPSSLLLHLKEREVSTSPRMTVISKTYIVPKLFVDPKQSVPAQPRQEVDS